MKLAGKARHLSSVKVTLSDWACQSGSSSVTTGDPNSNYLTDPGSHFKTAVTLNIYAAGVTGFTDGLPSFALGQFDLDGPNGTDNWNTSGEWRSPPRASVVPETCAN